MQTAPNNWVNVFAAPHKTQYRITINGTEYPASSIMGNPNMEKPMMLEPVIGRCCTGSLNLTVRMQAGVTIPKAAPVVMDCRLVSQDGQTVTDWLPQGRYWITKRSGFGSLLSLTCRDGMIFAGNTYLDKSQITEWPASMSQVFNEIVSILGVTVDSRTVINTGADYTVDYPNADVLMSEVLGMIAAAHGGNFIMTESGKLRLVKIPDTGATPETDLGTAYMDYTPYSTGANTISRITLMDNAGDEFTYGDDTGVMLSGVCSTATQALVNALSSIKGQTFTPYQISGAYIDPRLELGDTFTAVYRGQTVSLIANTIRVDCTTGYTAQLENGVMEDDEEEVPYLSPQQLKDNRTVRTDQTYHGNRINREEGFVSEYVVNGATVARFMANSNVLAMQRYDTDNSAWRDALYFDAVKGKYLFNGDVEINAGNVVNIASGGKFLINSANFSIDSEGNVSMTGAVNALSGTIGGWTIGPYSLFYSGAPEGSGSSGSGSSSGSGAEEEDPSGDGESAEPQDDSTNYVAISANPNDTYAIWSGSQYPGTAPFRVTKDGVVYATKIIAVDENDTSKLTPVNFRSTGYKLNQNSVKSYSKYPAETVDGASVEYCKTIMLSDGTVLNFKHATTDPASVAAEKTAASTATANSITVGTPSALISISVPVTVTVTDYTTEDATTDSGYSESAHSAYVSASFPALDTSLPSGASTVGSASSASLPASAVGSCTVYPKVTVEGVTFYGQTALDTSALCTVDSITVTNTPLTGTLYTGQNGMRYADTTASFAAYHNYTDGSGNPVQARYDNGNQSANLRVNIESILTTAEATAKQAGRNECGVMTEWGTPVFIAGRSRAEYVYAYRTLNGVKDSNVSTPSKIVRVHDGSASVSAYKTDDTTNYPKGYYEITPSVLVDAENNDNSVTFTAVKLDAADAYDAGVLAGAGSVVAPGVTGAWETTASANSQVPTTSNTFTVTENGTSNTASATLRLWAGNWSGNTIWVYMSSGQTSAVADRRLRYQVDASSVVSTAETAAANAVTINAPTWQTTPASGISASSNKAIFATSAATPATRDLNLYLNAGTWGPVYSNGEDTGNRQISVYLTHTSSGTASNRVAVQTVTANLQTKNVTPTSQEQIITCDGTYIGLSKVVVAPYTASTYGSFEGFTTAAAIAEGSASSTKPASYTGGQMTANSLTIRSVLSNDGGATYYTGDAVTVSASDLISAAETTAKNGVAITGPTWATTPASGISVSSNTATFSTNAPTPQSKSLVVNLVAGSWGPVTGSNNKQLNVYATHTNSNASNRIAVTTVTANLYSPGTITPTTSEQTISLPAGYIGFAGPLTIGAAESGGSSAVFAGFYKGSVGSSTISSFTPKTTDSIYDTQTYTAMFTDDGGESYYGGGTLTVTPLQVEEIPITTELVTSGWGTGDSITREPYDLDPDTTYAIKAYAGSSKAYHIFTTAPSTIVQVNGNFDGFSLEAVPEGSTSYTPLTGSVTAPQTVYAVVKTNNTYQSVKSVKINAPASGTHNVTYAWSGQFSSEVDATNWLDEDNASYSSSNRYASLSLNKWYAVQIQCGSDIKGLYFKTPADPHPSSISITNARWHSVSGNVYKGKLYYWDDDDESYSVVVNANKYWYYSDTQITGTTNVYY